MSARTRRRRGALVLATVAVTLAATVGSAVADDPPLGPDPGPAVDAARRTVTGAQGQVAAEDTALSAAEQGLAAAQNRLADLRRQAADLDAEVAGDRAEVARLAAETDDDKRLLYALVRNAFESGPNSAFLYIMAAGDFPEAVRRKAEIDRMGDAGTALVHRIGAEQDQASAVLADSLRAQDRLRVAQAQAVTADAVVAAQVDQVTAARQAAQQTLATDNVQLAGAVQAKQAWDTEQAARAARAAAAAREAAEAQREEAAHGGPPEPGVVYNPVATSTFTIDTDLTTPSGLTADRINSFLSGTAMSGLGDAFMAAEANHHVNARYFVAHAIEESSWGSSQIARVKHNLFGFGADDARPFADAVNFPSFQACIDYVSSYIYRHYLTPGGSFYHGPTLRGMNVDYASDRNWANNIARIARTIP